MSRPRRKQFRTAYLELTNVCNRSCSFCPGTRRTPRFMEPGLFQKLARETAPLAEIAYLHVMGEALLHPEFQPMMKTASEAGLMTGLTTNGTLFGHPNAKALFLGCFRQINVSLHAGISDSELAQITDFAKELPVRCPETYLNFRFWNYGRNRERTGECFRQIDRALGVECRYPEHEARTALRLKDRLSLHFHPEFEWPSMTAPVIPGPAFCHGCRNQFAVLADGQVTACCLDRDGDIFLGDAGEEPLTRILANGKTNAVRRGFDAGTAVEELCQHCSYRATLK
ncbi:MAG: molybdenum cofactor biosynthesis protein A [Lentisphaerae bacterium ADurb.Bin242]|nr:MAG: molybdenum cofactor biosynthesis protein A [Lentisphaerae bacterium ADurb.Bin242]